MRPTGLGSVLLLVSIAHASYDAITTLGHEICVPKTVQATVTVTVDASSGVEIGRSNSGPFDEASTQDGDYVKSVAGAFTTTKKHGHGSRPETDTIATIISKGHFGYNSGHDSAQSDTVSSPAKGSYEHGDGREYALSKASSTHKSVTKAYGASNWEKEEEAVVTSRSYGYGYGHDWDNVDGTHRTSTTRRGNVAASSSSQPSEEPEHSHHSQLSHATPSLHWSRWSNHSTTATTSKTSSFSTSDAKTVGSSSSHLVSSAPKSASSSATTSLSSSLSSSISSDASKISSTSTVDSSSSSLPSSSPTSPSSSETSTISSSASSSSTESTSSSSAVSSSSITESSSSSSIGSSSSSDLSTTSSITSHASSTSASSFITSSTSSAAPSCVTAGDKVVNGGFSGNTIAPFTESDMLVGPSHSGMQNDYREDVDNDGRFYTAFSRESAEGDTGVILRQSNIQIPSGTTVNCRASVRQSRADGGLSAALLSLDGQPCGDTLFLLREYDTWLDYGGNVVVSGNSHTLEITLLAGVVPENQLTVLSVDNIEVTPITLPAGISFCPAPAPTCINDGTLNRSCSADNDCCGFGTGSTCLSSICTACFTPANVLIDSSFGSGSFGGIFDPWAAGIGRGGDRDGDDIPTVEQGQSQDADGFSLSFPITEAGPIFLSQNFFLPEGSVVTCSFWVRDPALAFTEYTLNLAGRPCATGIGGPANEWFEINGSLTLESDVSQMTIELYSDAGNAVQEIDNIQVVLTASPQGAPTCPIN